MKRVLEVCIVRAAGIQHWVASVSYRDEENELLDPDIQARDPMDCIKMTHKEYPGIPVFIDADPFWTNNLPPATRKYLKA